MFYPVLILEKQIPDFTDIGCGGMEYPSESREVLPEKVHKLSLKKNTCSATYYILTPFQKTKQAIFFICFENAYVVIR